MISIIVPVYNVEGYIEKCIQSLMNQTYHNLEIILVDDGSTDGSGHICDIYANKDDRIIILHKENGGLSDARNYALDRAHGEFIAFVDGDDWVHPQMYELMQKVMGMWGADVVACGFEQHDVDFGSKRYGMGELNVKLLTGAKALSDIEEVALAAACNKLYKKELFDGIRYPKGKLHEDEFVIHRIYYRCNKVAIIDKSLYFYTIRSGSIMSQMTSKRINDALEAFADRVAFADKMEWREVITAVIKRYCDYCMDMYYYIKNGNFTSAEYAYLDILWEAERDIVQKYPCVKLARKYRSFAKSPKQYERFVDRRNLCKTLLRQISNKVLRINGVRK